MCLVKCIFPDQIIFMVHTPFKLFWLMHFEEKKHHRLLCLTPQETQNSDHIHIALILPHLGSILETQLS